MGSHGQQQGVGPLQIQMHGFAWAVAGRSPPEAGISSHGQQQSTWVHMGGSRVRVPSRGVGSHGQQQGAGPLQRHGFAWAAAECETPPVTWAAAECGYPPEAWVHKGSNMVWIPSRGMGSPWAAGCGHEFTWAAAG